MLLNPYYLLLASWYLLVTTNYDLIHSFCYLVLETFYMLLVASFFHWLVHELFTTCSQFVFKFFHNFFHNFFMTCSGLFHLSITSSRMVHYKVMNLPKLNRLASLSLAQLSPSLLSSKIANRCTKNEVDLCRKSIGAIRCGLAMSYNDVQCCARLLNFSWHTFTKPFIGAGVVCSNLQ